MTVPLTANAPVPETAVNCASAYRTHTCGQLTKADVGQHIMVSGWLHRKRDHGSLVFLDLRDHYGITQCVIEENNPLFA